MIILDTHVWVWWMSSSPRLAAAHRERIAANSAETIGISVISCWEVAMLAERRRIGLNRPVLEWIDRSLRLPRVQLMALTPEIAVESTQLPGNLHRDPADRFIVATARVHDCELLTSDALVLRYPHVRTVGP